MAKTKLTKVEKAKRRKRAARQIKGFLFTLFAAVGVFSIIFLIVGRVTNSVGEDADKDAYANLIAPLVALDPVPFEGTENANINVLTESAIWAVYANEDTEKYKRTESDQLLLPLVDIDRYFTKMYGRDVDMIRRKDFSVVDIEYLFDKATDCYILPVTGQVGNYRPVVTDISTSGGTKVLTVAYVRNHDAWSSTSANTEDLTEDEVVKYMEYILMKSDDSWHIYAVRTPKLNG